MKGSRMIATLACWACLIQELMPCVPLSFAAPEEAETQPLSRIEIYSAEDLEELAENCHDDAWSADKEVVLMQDISLNGSDFSSIPIFAGHFDGNEHAITGYSYSGDGYVTGFFRYLSEEAVVEDLTLSAQIKAGGTRSVTGGIVGINFGTLKECCFEGRIRGRSETGGIAAINEADGNIFDCVNRAEINGYYYTGGICGKNYGMVYGCRNEGSLNNSVEWVEEDDAMGGELFSDLMDADRPETRSQTGVDTGGIAGYSRGALIKCDNEGAVGYEHTGYNVGGIVGRQSGTVSNCINHGTVLGRKDVGGIVGQMEPYIELTEGESVSEEVRLLHDMVNELLDLMDQDNATVRTDLQALQKQADAAADVGDRMTDQASDYANANLEVINEGSRRLSYVLDQMPNVTGNVTLAGKDIKKMAAKLKKANEDLYLEGYMSEADKKKADELLDELEELADELEELQTAKKSATAGFWVHSVIGEEKKDDDEGGSESDNSASENESEEGGSAGENESGEGDSAGENEGGEAGSASENESGEAGSASENESGEESSSENSLKEELPSKGRSLGRKRLQAPAAEEESGPQAVASYVKQDGQWVEITDLQDGWFQLQEGAEYRLHGECLIAPVNSGVSITISGNSYGGVKVKDLPGEGEADKEGYYIVTTKSSEELARQTVLMTQIVSDMAQLLVIYAPYVDEASAAVSTDVSEALDELEAAAEAAGMAQSSLESINAYLNAQPDLQMVKVDQEWNDNMDSIHRQLDAMSGTMSSLGNHSTEYSTAVNEKLRAINDQINKIYGLLEERISAMTDEDKTVIYADISDAELSSITMGKVGSCMNYGSIRGDVNIGGIAGTMAIDEEDPEENAAGTVTLNLNGRYTTQDVMSNCTNRGYITAKNDGAGGLVGFMKSGVVSRCYGYGFVESTDGGYVGGIAGQSLAVIRDCDVLCSLSGGNYVGGVAGMAATLTGCYAMPMVQQYKSRCGAIAGGISIDEDTHAPKLDKVENNYFVSDVLDGIDQISYRNSAAAMSYEELLRTPGIPPEFRLLTVTFRVGDEYLGAQQIHYGDDISKISFPEIPAVEGKYGRWPQLPWDKVMGNLVITAEYIDSVKVLESAAVDESSGKKLALIDRNFDDKAELYVLKVETPGFEKAGYEDHVTYDLRITGSDVSGIEEVKLRLYDPYGEEVELWRYEDGLWEKEECLVRGSYLQVSMRGDKAVYTLAKPQKDLRILVCAGSGVALVVIIIILIHMIRGIRKRKKKA